MSASCWVSVVVGSEMGVPALGESTVQSLPSGERVGAGHNLHHL